jgi:hypothetical protein
VPEEPEELIEARDHSAGMFDCHLSSRHDHTQGRHFSSVHGCIIEAGGNGQANSSGIAGQIWPAFDLRRKRWRAREGWHSVP